MLEAHRILGETARSLLGGLKRKKGQAIVSGPVLAGTTGQESHRESLPVGELSVVLRVITQGLKMEQARE